MTNEVIKEEEKRILKEFSKWLDDQLDFKKIIGGIVGAGIETVDRFVFSTALDFAYSKVPAEYKAKILDVLEAVVHEDAALLKTVAIEEAVSLLKSPLGDEKEEIIIGGIIEIIFDLIRIK